MEETTGREIDQSALARIEEAERVEEKERLEILEDLYRSLEAELDPESRTR